VGALIASPALGQGVVRGAPTTAANGLKVGDGRLHPFIDLELRLDSAPGFFPIGGSGSPISPNPSPELVLRPRPGIKLEVPSPTVSLDLDGMIEYVYYTGLLRPGSTLLSRVQGAANLLAAFNRNGTVEFDLGDSFSYSDRTPSVVVAQGVLSLINEARGMLIIRPGGGALEIAPKGAFTVEFLRPLSSTPDPNCTVDPVCQLINTENMDYSNIRPGLEARWKFLPKTALVLDATFDIRSYFVAATNQPAMLLKAQAGLQGLVTTKIAAVTKLGWGYDFAPNTPGRNAGANTLIAHAEITYLMNEASYLRAGYIRTVEPVPLVRSYQDDRGFAEARFLFMGRLLMRAYGAFDLFSFAGVAQTPPAPPLPGRTDIGITIDASAEYQIFPWLYGAAGYVLTNRTSSVSSRTLNVTRHEPYVRVTGAY
jgi:hypothetical protein